MPKCPKCGRELKIDVIYDFSMGSMELLFLEKPCLCGRDKKIVRIAGKDKVEK